MLSQAALALAALPLGLALHNLGLYRTPAAASGRSSVSVLIPARNEEQNIADAVACVLANKNVDLELCVLDDGSTDRTPHILRGIADPRLRIIEGRGLPPGWSGKQNACALLSQAARHDIFVFVDADVRLAPDALSRMLGFMERNDVGLASGFPRQVTKSWSEILLLPLIHMLLLGYLPIARMRVSMSPSLGAGCGQLFIARRQAYERAGGHGAIKASLHDGLTLPRAFRRSFSMTGLFDATNLASCRMYENAETLWEGLTKNATEGMAKPLSLPVWTVILAGGHIVPAALVLLAPSPAAIAALACNFGLRLVLAWRFRQSAISALLHPFGVAALLAVQWFSLSRAASGRPATWRGRAYKAQS